MKYQIVINYDSETGAFDMLAPVSQAPVIAFGMLQQALATATNSQKPPERGVNGLTPVHGVLGRLASQ